MQGRLVSVLLIPLIMVGEVVLESNHLATWPAMMIMIFYFMSHTNIKESPAILIGSFFGICNLIFVKAFVPVVTPLFGGDLAKITSPETAEAMFHGKLLYIAIFVIAIILLRDVLPWIFNNYAFMFFLISALAANGNGAVVGAVKTLAGSANAVVATGGNPAAIVAMKAATDKAVAGLPVTDLYQWMGIELIGGGLLLLGVYGITLVAAKVFGAPADPGHADVKG